MNAKSEAGSRLIFAWPERYHVSFKLAWFLLISFGVHASAFYFFQIVYPPTKALLPQPAQFTLLAPTNQENKLLLQRIESEDPACVVVPALVLPEQPVKIEYKPYFEQLHDTLQLPELTPDRAAYPPVESPAALVNTQLSAPEIPQIVATPAPTEMTVSGELRARSPKKLPSISFTTRSETLLDRATFLFAVSDLGEVRYCFLEHGSGDAAVDAKAASYLKTLRFSRSQIGMEWGFASFHWGDDLYTPQKSAAAAANHEPLANRKSSLLAEPQPESAP